MPFCKPLLVAAALVAAASTDTAAAADDAQEQFEQKIRPVLLTQCVRCHGAEKTSSGLRVDSREKLLAGGDNGPAVVPGKPDESLLLAALRGTGELKRMPPDAPLPADAVADFEAWIRAGAVWPDTLATRNAFAAQQHWAFRPVADVAPPDLENAWSDHPIDRFLEAEWRRHGLIPAGEAEPRTLIRRLAFDLTGLPPDPDEVARFVRDCAESSVDAAFSREIDRRLESPRYGERWGRHWMDVVRYADTAGDNAD